MAQNFNVGDRVVCIKSVDGNEDIVGKTGEIVIISSRPGVRFDEMIQYGHSIGNGEEGYGWWCDEDALELDFTASEEFQAPEPVWG